jgi:hypothetical protein
MRGCKSVAGCGNTKLLEKQSAASSCVFVSLIEQMGAAASANVRGRLEYIAFLEAEVQMLRAEKQDALRKVTGIIIYFTYILALSTLDCRILTSLR